MYVILPYPYSGQLVHFGVIFVSMCDTRFVPACDASPVLLLGTNKIHQLIGPNWKVHKFREIHGEMIMATNLVSII